MKNGKMLKAAVLAVMLVCGGALTGCKTEADRNLFLGIWQGVIGGEPKAMQLVFTESHWEFTDDTRVVEGTYTHENTVATMIISSDMMAMTSTIDAGILRLMSDGDLLYLFVR
jgi:hypothetical protein